MWHEQKLPGGISAEEAGLTGLWPPLGYKPPQPDRPRDVARSVGALTSWLAPLLGTALRTRRDAWPRTTNAEGLKAIAGGCRDLLRRLDVRVEVEGRVDVPSEGGLVFMWNQESHLDHVVLPSVLPRPFFSLYNNAVARWPIYAAYLRDSGHVHIDKTNEGQWRRGIAHAAEQIRGGACVLVSPEGTRSWDGNLLPMKRGAFILAIQSRCPIVCLTLIASHGCLPRGASAVRPGVIRAVFSEPIPTDGHDPELRGPLKQLVVDEFTRVKREFGRM